MRDVPNDPHSRVRDYETLRHRMVEEQLSGIRDGRVLQAMRAVPRHLFAPELLRSEAYAGKAIPVGHGLDLSEPLTIANLLQAAELRGDERALEIGTGSGYQAALLSRLASEVWTLEIVPEVFELARHNLLQAGYPEVHLLQGDGGAGWPKASPYDAIVVSAATDVVPAVLVEQLALGGRLVIPLGSPRVQVIQRVKRTGSGLVIEDLELCTLPPLAGAHGPSWAIAAEDKDPLGRRGA